MKRTDQEKQQMENWRDTEGNAETQGQLWVSLT